MQSSLIGVQFLLLVFLFAVGNAFEGNNNTIFGCDLPEIVNIHTFGDSHSRWHQSILGQVRTKCNLQEHSISGKTMFGAVKMGIDVINFKKYKIQKNAIVMFNFGEIDSRNHLHRFRDTGLYKEMVRLVDSYEELILANRDLEPSIHIWIGGLIPTKFNPKVRHIGTNYERFLYNRLLNDEIMRMARRNNFFYLDNYADYADDSGFLSFEFSDGGHHIGP